MILSKGKVVNGQLETFDSKEISSSNITSDCWPIQFYGLDACKKCEYKNTKECGGKNIIKKLKKK